MACDTCGHTMENLGLTKSDGLPAFWWCPRCGTIKWNGAAMPMTQPPALVARILRIRTPAIGRAEPCPHYIVQEYDWRAITECVGQIPPFIERKPDETAR